MMEEWLSRKAGPNACLKVNVPILRYLEGGLTDRHIQSYLCDLIAQRMSGMLYHGNQIRAKISLDEPITKSNGESDGTPLVDTLSNENDKSTREIVEDNDFKEQLHVYPAMLGKALQTLRDFDSRCADYVHLTKIGTAGLPKPTVMNPEVTALWQKWQEAGVPMPARDARIVSGIGRNNTNAFDNRMRKFLSEVKAGSIEIGLPADMNGKLIEFFSSMIAKKA